jgi:indolepyruvate ferredoxin oxidoreductase beta subunit
MSGRRSKVVVVGVGGQGSVFVARVLGEAALRSEVGVVASELHGMAQRGGVVESTVILGDAHGPIIPHGEADLLIALEPLEALRALGTARRGGAAVVGTTPIVPFTVSLGAPPYPPVEEILARLKGWLGTVLPIDLVRLATDAGEHRALGAVALGAAASLELLPVDTASLREATISMAPPRKQAENAAAFDAGYDAGFHP